jgi:hypothetical protein
MNVRRKPQAVTHRQKWRITPGVAGAEPVDPTATTAPPMPEAREWQPANWAMSSFDLLYGADVNEVSDTVPDALFDQLFAPKDGAPKTQGN